MTKQEPMNKFNFTALIFAAWLLTVSFSTVRAQTETPPAQQSFNQKQRSNFLAELNLSPDQIQQIRRINREQQPLKRAAQQRLQAAKSSLDRAIYADDLDEREIQVLLKEMQTAQTEVFRIKAMNEVEIRKVLAPEQLVKFRDARERFKQMIENLPKQRDNRPGQRLFNRQRRLRQN